jgi:hypothetical protein
MPSAHTRICLAAILAAGLLSWAAVAGTAPAASGQERWTGTIDLRQGDSGTIEIARTDGVISGRMLIKRGGTLIETPIRGEWTASGIFFSRSLSDKSVQPFKGVVIAVDARHVRMEGQFAAGFSGRWTSECTLVEAPPEMRHPEPPPSAKNAPAATDNRRREPPPAARDTIAPIETITTRRPLGPSSRVGVLLDFLEQAPTAKWTNAWTVLAFPGSESDASGYARSITNARLEDGKTYARVLETRPHAQPRGRIMGWYAHVAVPPGGAQARAGIGYRDGASGSDGVYFVVRGEFPGYSGIDVRREYLKPYDKFPVTDFVQDLSRFKGLEGTVILSVDAGPKSADQDLAVWIEPTLVSTDKEPAFASFVGGAVGSGRNGAQLVNAGGGKSGQLYGNVTLYLLFANIDAAYSVKIESFQGGTSTGTTDLGTTQKGQNQMWVTLTRTIQGECRERVIFNGTYVGDIRYTIAKSGE